MPSALLQRRLQVGRPTSITLTPNQILADQAHTQMAEALSDPIALTAMSIAPLFGKLGRMGSLVSAERWFGNAATAISSLASQATAGLIGFSVEVIAFESIHRGMRIYIEGAAQSLFNWENLKEGLSHSFLNFGILKMAGMATAGSPPLLGHFATDAAMVAGNQTAAALGMIPSPAGSLLQQFVIADAMNWQMRGGLSLFHKAMPSLGMKEKALDLTWQSQFSARDLQFFQAHSFAMEGFGKNLIFMSATDPGKPGSIPARPKVALRPEVSASREVKSYTLRDFQEQMLRSIHEDVLKGVSPWLGLASPMQTGKSFLAGPIIQRLREVYGPQARFIVLTSARVITKQVKNDLLEGFSDNEVGVYDGKNKQIQTVTVASVFTLIRHLKDFVHQGPTILINDEAYSTQAPMYRAIYTHFGLGEIVKQGGKTMMRPKVGNGLVVGLSGTGVGLEGYKMSGQLNILDAIDQGWIRHMRGDRVMLTIPSEKRESVEDRDMIWWEATQANAETLSVLYGQYIYGKYARSSIYVPTIAHAELLKDALRKRYGREHAFTVHSKMEQKGELGIDQDFDKVMDYWEKNGGAVISIGQLSRGYRGKGIDACFHTYQSSSSELFGQRTGRGWAAIPGEVLPDYYVLEATWNSKSNYANLPRLLGLVDYPQGEFSSRGLQDRVKNAKKISEAKADMNEQIREARVLPIFEQLPLLESWRTVFAKILETSAGVNGLVEKTGLSIELLAGFALGGLPVHRESILALKDFLTKDALYLWVKFWTEATVEISKGIQKVEDRFSKDLLDWAVVDREFHVQLEMLDQILQKYFPKPKSKIPIQDLLDSFRVEVQTGLSDEALTIKFKEGRERLIKFKKDPLTREIIEKRIFTENPGRIKDIAEKFGKDPSWIRTFEKRIKKELVSVVKVIVLGNSVIKDSPSDSQTRLDMPLESLRGSIEMTTDLITYCSGKAGTVRDLLGFTENSLLKLGIPEQSVRELKEVLSQMKLALRKNAEEPLVKEVPKKIEMDPLQILFNKPIQNLTLFSQTLNLLRTQGIETVGQVVKMSPADFLKIPNFKKSTLREVNEALDGMGLYVGMKLGTLPVLKVEELAPKPRDIP